MSETACNDSELDDAVLDIIDFVATSNITPMESSNTASNNNTGTLVGGLTSVTSTIRSVATSAVSVFGQVLHDFTATNTSDSHPSATMGSPATTMGSPATTMRSPVATNKRKKKDASSRKSKFSKFSQLSQTNTSQGSSSRDKAVYCEMKGDSSWHLSDELVLSKHNAEFTSIERRLLRTLVHSVTNKAFDDIVSEYEFPSKDNSSQTKMVLPTDITQKENTIHRWYSIIESNLRMGIQKYSSMVRSRDLTTIGTEIINNMEALKAKPKYQAMD